MDHAHLDHALARLRPPLHVLGVASPAPDPRVGPLDHPTPRLQHGPLRALGAPDSLEAIPRRVVLQVAVEPVLLVLRVPPHHLQSRVRPPAEPVQHPRRGGAVVGVRRRDQHDQQQPHGIRDDVPLPPRDLLAAVVAPLAPECGGLDGPRVDHRDPRRRLPAGGLADPGPQRVEDRLPGAVVTPAGEVAGHRALGEQVVGEHVPLAAGAVEVEQRVEDLAHVDRAGPAAGLGRGDQRPEDRPLVVGEVGRVGPTHGGRSRGPGVAGLL
jgi:hypothetical protein